MLTATNGFVCYGGGLHVRGAVVEPAWHSLRAAWLGASSLAFRYPAVKSSDVPFAEDCVGDQFLLRQGEVVRLRAETGELEPSTLSLSEFLERCDEDRVEFLEMEPLLQLQSEGKHLQPGQLIHAYPPFCTHEAGLGVSLRPVPTNELLVFHAQLAQVIGGLPDGARLRVVVE